MNIPVRFLKDYAFYKSMFQFVATWQNGKSWNSRKDRRKECSSRQSFSFLSSHFLLDIRTFISVKRLGTGAEVLNFAFVVFMFEFLIFFSKAYFFLHEKKNLDLEVLMERRIFLTSSVKIVSFFSRYIFWNSNYYSFFVIFLEVF